jgi:hypothetical protein
MNESTMDEMTSVEYFSILMEDLKRDLQETEDAPGFRMVRISADGRQEDVTFEHKRRLREIIEAFEAIVDYMRQEESRVMSQLGGLKQT